MKLTLLFSALIFILSSCFKDAPTTEYSKVAGSWMLDKVSIENYDTLGNEISTQTFKDRGYILLDFNDDFLASSGFAYSFNVDDPSFNASEIKAKLALSEIWDVSVDAKHLNFGTKDPATGYTVMVIALSITKLNSRHMHLQKINLNPDGSMARKEVYELKRGN